MRKKKYRSAQGARQRAERVKAEAWLRNLESLVILQI
jgi:hypothetical protein